MTVAVTESGAMLEGTAPTEVTFAAGAATATLTVATADDDAAEAARDYEAPDDADTDGVYAVTVQVIDGANPVEAALTVSLTDEEERAPAGTVWSARMTVVEYGTGAVGAATADLFANQVGSGNLRAKWLWYQPSERKLRLAFDAGVADAEELRLHLGERALSFPANSGGDSSFSWEDVDIAWTDGQTVAVRVAKPLAEADGADETVTDDTAAPVVATASPILAPRTARRCWRPPTRIPPWRT